MNVSDLRDELKKLGFSEHRYSLNGELIADTVILNKNYETWEVFYFDERGCRNNEKKFDSENDACEFILKIFNDAQVIEQKFGLKAY